MTVCKKRARQSSHTAMKKKKKKKMGRPKEYLESWTKRMIFLRHCGLDLKGILQLLHGQSDGQFAPKERRCQQLIRELLAEEGQRFQPPNESTARGRAAFLRAALRRRTKVTPQVQMHVLAIKSSTKPAPAEPVNKQSPSIVTPHIARTMATETGTALEIDWNYSAVCVDCGGFGPGHICWPTDMVAAPATPSQAKAPRAALQLELQHSSKRPESRRRLSIQSFSSTFVSDLKSLLNRRFSSSTYDTSDRYSRCSFSATEAVTESREENVKRVLQARLRQHAQDNTTLIRVCCSRRLDCVHRVIQDLTQAYPGLPSKTSSIPWQPDGRPLQDITASFRGTLFDAHKHGVLFFAARIGAPFKLLLELLHSVPDFNTIDASGQTWLHSLDPRVLANEIHEKMPAETPIATPFHDCHCDPRYTRVNPHLSRFECMMFELDRTSIFDFDRLDNHGRHFLFYVCASQTFDIHWLLHIVSQHPEWRDRVNYVIQLRDRAGLFLKDYLAARPDYVDWNTDIRSIFDPELGEDFPVRLLRDEQQYGRTSLHAYVQEMYNEASNHSALPFPDDIVARDINRYDVDGRTPIMNMVENACERGSNEDDICAKVEQLVQAGANVNSCSRSGMTVLLFAARKAYPKLVQLLLRLGARSDHCDDSGQDALAHVRKTLRISQSAQGPVELLSRGLRTAAKLLDVENSAFRNRKRAAKASITDFSPAELTARSKRTLQKLLEHVEAGIIAGPPVGTQSWHGSP